MHKPVLAPHPVVFDTSEQGSEGWRAARAGYATASCFKDIMGSVAASAAYCDALVTERLYGEPSPEVHARSLQWGKEAEAYARMNYTMQTGHLVREVGFAHHPTIAMVGASSDGLIGVEGGIEIKSPHDPKVHMRTWRDGMPKDHMPQVQGGMWVIGLHWIDFISYDPRAPEHLRVYIERIHRDEAYIGRLEVAVRHFLAKVSVQVEAINSKALARYAALQQTPGA